MSSAAQRRGLSIDLQLIAAFERLRLAIINHAPLVPFDSMKSIFVASDACDAGYEGVVFFHYRPAALQMAHRLNFRLRKSEITKKRSERSGK